MHRGTHNDSKMEVPGRAGDQAHLPDCRDIHCEPCKAAGSVLEAQGYCKKCAEYLCQGCLDHHKRLKITRNHTLLDKANMPKDSQGRSSDLPCTEPCVQHAGETLQYFCADHEVIGCTVCTTMGHRTCNVQYLPDVAKGYKRTDEYKAFVGSVDGLANALQHADQEIQDNLDTADDAHTAAIRDIEQFRDRINAYLDRKKKDLRATTKLQKEKTQKSMENARKDCQKIGKDVKDLQSQLHQEDNDLVKLFSRVKRSRTYVRSLQQESSSLQERIQTPTFRFQPSATIETLISNNTPLGEIIFNEPEPLLGATASPVVLPKKPMSDMKLTQSSTIKLKSAADTKTPWYTGLEMLSDNRILVADCDNSSLQIVNTSSQQITSRLTLSGTPRDVTCLPGDQAAVTIPDQHKITVVSTKGKLSAVRDIRVSGRCWGITYTDGKLVVTYQHPGSRVDMLTMTGDVIKEIKYDRHGKQLFEYPEYITTQTTATATHLYVSDVNTGSDWDTDTIKKIAMTGDVVCQYSQSAPQGIQALGDGYVAVCCCWDSSILLLEDTGAQMKKVKQWKCVARPRALVMSAMRDTIYVSSDSDTDAGNFLHVYKLTD